MSISAQASPLASVLSRALCQSGPSVQTLELACCLAVQAE